MSGRWKTACVQFLQIGMTFFVMGGVLFLAAGKTDWTEAWVFLIVYFLIAFFTSVWLLIRDPALVRERSRAIAASNVKKWDKAVLFFNLLLTLAWFGAIGLDAGRWQASAVPPLLRLAGGFLALGSFGITLWASGVNTYLSAMVRIQAERGHRTVTAGPYRWIRHPMYAGMLLLDVGIPLLMNSWWSLAVSALMILTLFIRTAREDATLQKELPGYPEYARSVRHRLLPGVW